MANRVPLIGNDGTVARKRAFTERLASIWHPLALGIACRAVRTCRYWKCGRLPSI